MSTSTDTFVVPPKKSTNVRTSSSRLDESIFASAWPLRAVARLSPALAGRMAAKAFFTTFRPPVRPEEAALLVSFDRDTLDLGARGRIPVWSLGEGPTVILNHGWSGRAAQLAPLAAALATAGMRAVIFDHPAHGEAAGNMTTLPHMRAVLEEVDRWSGGARAVVAHSLGAVMTILAMAGPLAPRRVVLIAPPIHPPSWSERFARKLGLGPDVDEPMRRALERRAGVSLASLDPRPIARAQTAPLLVVHDYQDREVPFSAGEKLARLWPNAELFGTSGLGHYRILRDPTVGERIASFLT